MRKSNLLINYGCSNLEGNLQNELLISQWTSEYLDNYPGFQYYINKEIPPINLDYSSILNLATLDVTTKLHILDGDNRGFLTLRVPINSVEPHYEVSLCIWSFRWSDLFLVYIGSFGIKKYFYRKAVLPSRVEYLKY